MSYLLAALISRASTFSANKRTQCLLKTLYSVDLVAMPEGPHPIPFRTRSLSLPGPMVLCLKSRESRSSPGLQNTGVFSDASHNPSLQSNTNDRQAIRLAVVFVSRRVLSLAKRSQKYRRAVPRYFCPYDPLQSTAGQSPRNTLKGH